MTNSPRALVPSPLKMKQISRDGLAKEELKSIKIENAIGFAKVPIGVAGPLSIDGLYQKQENIYAPLATVEATLVASCSRGCKVMQACGGVKAAALDEGMSRAPVFRFASIGDALAFYKLVPSLESRFREVAEQSSRFARLTTITPHILGSTVHVKFTYTCGDAAGQNMTTLGTHKACTDFLYSPAAKRAKVIGFNVDGQLSGDKKLAWGNVHHPRGVRVMAWVTIRNDVSQKILKCNTITISRTLSIFQDGMIRNGGVGNSINPANIMAAMFIACGQDTASVLEGGYAHIIHELNPENQDLTLSLFFPSLPVGSIGGGTSYGTQKEALEMIECYGAGRKFALAETIAAFCLALDLSTISAIATDTFAQSHQRFARESKL